MTTTENRAARAQPLKPLWLSGLCVVVGVVAGLGAVVFRGLIAIVHNFLFRGQFSPTYHTTVHTPPSPWGPLVIFAPVIGAVGVVLLVKNFAPEARGRGVSEVMDAIYYDQGKIRPVVAVIKSLASALTIGSGGSAGREGPIIQVGASFGSMLGQLLRVPTWQLVTLIAGGASGGIAATFNTPIGGILFVLETMMPEVSVRTLVPMAVATVAATSVGWLCFGAGPSFTVQDVNHTPVWFLLPACALLGLLLGLVSVLFIKSVFGCENFFEHWPAGGYFWQHVAGMFGVGLILYTLMRFWGHYYVGGVGYATVQNVLTQTSLPLFVLLALFALKLLVTALTLGSGASGGVFSPALFLGATLGGAYGMVLAHLFPNLGVIPPVFAAVGMAGVVGGATGAALAAVVMIFEMTRDYPLVAPMILAVAISYGVRKLFCRESIYTLKLARQGHVIPNFLHANPRYFRPARDFMSTDFGLVRATVTLGEFARTPPDNSLASVFLVVEGGQIIGFVRAEDVLPALRGGRKSATLGEISNRRFVAVNGTIALHDLLEQMHERAADVAVVMDNPNSLSTAKVQGLIRREHLADELMEASELFGSILEVDRRK
ncbi:MAG TPA: chloride channel protein [Verrucomicrobiae bacterium]|nr:chloride channel protein [Verrucomicrobiae bacterium]